MSTNIYKLWKSTTQTKGYYQVSTNVMDEPDPLNNNKLHNYNKK